jgi:uncharacterized protein YjiK
MHFFARLNIAQKPLACTLLLGLTVFGLFGQKVSPDSFPYDLANPFFSVSLASEELKEISGIGVTNEPNEYIAIADEQGKIFFVDGESGKIKRTVSFKDSGDFEGVEMTGPCLFAVKSNGDIYEIDRWKRPSKMVVMEYETPLSKKDDVEGLCYDPSRRALLLACKGDPDSTDTRKIYAWDMKSKQLGEKPVYTIDPLKVEALVPTSGEEKPSFFSPSGIAVHPQTSNIYVISTAKKRLVVLDHGTGEILFAIRLDKALLPQPEGISFDKEANLLISSEGKKGSGMILKYKMRK